MGDIKKKRERAKAYKASCSTLELPSELIEQALENEQNCEQWERKHVHYSDKDRANFLSIYAECASVAEAIKKYKAAYNDSNLCYTTIYRWAHSDKYPKFKECFNKIDEEITNLTHYIGINAQKARDKFDIAMSYAVESVHDAVNCINKITQELTELEYSIDSERKKKNDALFSKLLKWNKFLGGVAQLVNGFLDKKQSDEQPKELDYALVQLIEKYDNIINKK